MSYETYAHAKDMVEIENREAIKMKGINREIKVVAVKGRSLVEKGSRIRKIDQKNKEVATKESIQIELGIEGRLKILESKVNDLIDEIAQSKTDKN